MFQCDYYIEHLDKFFSHTFGDDFHAFLLVSNDRIIFIFIYQNQSAMGNVIQYIYLKKENPYWL